MGGIGKYLQGFCGETLTKGFAWQNLGSDVRGDWRNLQNDSVHDLYCSRKIIEMIRSSRLK